MYKIDEFLEGHHVSFLCLQSKRATAIFIDSSTCIHDHNRVLKFMFAVLHVLGLVEFGLCLQAKSYFCRVHLGNEETVCRSVSVGD